MLLMMWVVEHLNYRLPTTKDETGEKLERNNETCSRNSKKIKFVKDHKEHVLIV